MSHHWRARSLSLASLTALALVLLSGVADAAFPGGNGLLAVQPVTGSGIELVNPNGTGGRLICASSPACTGATDPRFSPDGQSIIFSDVVGRESQPQVISLSGGCLDCRFSPYLDGNGAATSPGFLPDGTEVSYLAQYQVVVSGTDGLFQKVFPAADAPSSIGLVPAADVPVTGAQWSVRDDLTNSTNGHVWVYHRGQWRRLGAGTEPDWSPTGESIALVRDGWIWIVSASTGRGRRLVRGSQPTFSPNGAEIAFISAAERVEIVPERGGKIRSVGALRGLRLDWQPVRAHPPASCVAPTGSAVLASSPTAVVTQTAVDSNPDDSLSSGDAVTGCLKSVGQDETLVSFGNNSDDSASSASVAAVNGNFAAIVTSSSDAHYGGGTGPALRVFDLRTGAIITGTDDGGLTLCDFGCGVPTLLVSPDGIAAGLWEQSTSCPGSDSDALACEEYEVFIAGGSISRPLDEITTSPADPTGTLSGLKLTGQTLTWLHGNTQESATLP